MIRVCARVQEDRFQGEAGKTFCEQCPARTRREQGAFKSIAACKCERGLEPGSGSWAPDLARAYDCLRCPIGGVCEGGLYRPYAQQGFWTIEISTARTHADGNTSMTTDDARAWQTSGTEQSGTFVPCESFVDDEYCKGGNLNITATCMTGYGGRACSECASSHYRFFAMCWTCEGSGKVLNSFLVVGMVVLWVLINFYLCEEVDSLDTFLAFAQMLNVIGTFSVAWPSGVGLIFTVAAVFDFDVCTAYL